MRLIDAKKSVSKVDAAFALYLDHNDILQLYSDVRLAIIDAPTISPDSLVKRGRCELCEDYDNIANMVCYIPLESGEAKDIPVNFCPVCGGALMED